MYIEKLISIKVAVKLQAESICDKKNYYHSRQCMSTASNVFTSSFVETPQETQCKFKQID